MNFLEKTDKHQKADFLDKQFLVWRDHEMAWLLSPVKVRIESKCALTGHKIQPHQYAYRCFTNPIRLSPYGTSRCHVNAAISRGNEILPAGYYAIQIPTTDQMKKRGAFADTKRSKELKIITHNLLTGKK